MKSLMRIIVLGLLFACSVACTQVPPGNVGVMVNLSGGDKGVSPVAEVSPGWYWVGPFRDLYLFPTFSQTRAWQGGEALSFSTVEGMTVTADEYYDMFIHLGDMAYKLIRAATIPVMVIPRSAFVTD